MQNVNDFFTGNEHHPLMRPTNKLEKPEWTVPDTSMRVTLVLIRYGSRISYHLYDLKAGVFNPPPNKKEAVPKVMSEALIEPFNRWFLSLRRAQESLVEMTATLNVVVSINSTTVMQTYWTASSISDSTLLEYADWYECVSLQRSTANQTTVDIWLCQKFWSV